MRALPYGTKCILMLSDRTSVLTVIVLPCPLAGTPEVAASPAALLVFCVVWVCCGCGAWSVCQACQIIKDTNRKAMRKRLRCESIVNVLWYQRFLAAQDRHHPGSKGGILIRVLSSTNCLLQRQSGVRPQSHTANRWDGTGNEVPAVG